MKRVLFYILIAFALVSCRDNIKVDPAFLASEQMGLVLNGQQLFTYDALNCQYAFNRNNRVFRLHTDTMSDYVKATLSDIPAEKGQKLSGEIEWTTERDIKTKKLGSLLVAKISDDGTVWLWSNADKLGLTVRIPD